MPPHLIADQRPPAMLQRKLDALALEGHQLLLQGRRDMAVALRVVGASSSSLQGQESGETCEQM